jgi:hypothetical protein
MVADIPLARLWIPRSDGRLILRMPAIAGACSVFGMLLRDAPSPDWRRRGYRIWSAGAMRSGGTIALSAGCSTLMMKRFGLSP